MKLKTLIRSFSIEKFYDPYNPCIAATVLINKIKLYQHFSMLVLERSNNKIEFSNGISKILAPAQHASVTKHYAA